jgi:uncharacterized protein YndB with AHSA1/START domain
MKLWLPALMFSMSLFASDGVSFVNEGVIDAPMEEVWKVFSTSEGYKILGPALVEIDLHVGGTIRSRYRADGTLGDEETIENVILAYEPPTMMAIQIQKPPKTFPFKEAWKHTWSVITLSPVEGDKTHIRISSLGYGTDEESLAMRRFFEFGNQLTLENIQKHFTGRRK